MTPYLSRATLDRVSPGVLKPDYDPQTCRIGVVHFGPGAFHRAHQAYFLDRLLSRDPRWGICGVSLHSPTVRDALVPQDCLYTLAELDENPSFRVIGALRELLVATESPERVLTKLCDPQTHVVTLTVTEKGYCLDAAGDLDMQHPDIAHDANSPQSPASVVGFLVEALARRRAARMRPPTIISCDNLTENGTRLARAVSQLAATRDPDLARWIETEVCFPCTMVDSITPATTEKLKERVNAMLGVIDRWPVQRESFVQWVMEDRFGSPVPDWQAAGIVVTNDVAAYEKAKLRLVNGAHSTLAYTGLLLGHETIEQAMRDPLLSAFVRALMLEDIVPSLTAPRGLDLGGYVRSILKRFQNSAIRHQLSQIAWDGSQKLPVRIFGTIRDALAAGRPIDRLCVPVAAWMHFVRRQSARNIAIVDPLAEALSEIGRACTGRARDDVPKFLTLDRVFTGDLISTEGFLTTLSSVYDALPEMRLRV